MSKNLLLSAAFAFGLAAPALAQDGTDLDTVVATVGQTEITVGHMLAARSQLPQEYQQLPNEVLWDGLVNQLIQYEVLAQDPEAVETDRVRLMLENERRALLASETISSVANNAVTEDKLRAAYEETYVQGPNEPEYNASHILVDSEEEAARISAELRGGGDFAAAAREYSTGPSGPNGGSLGWFSEGMMVAPFQTAVETLRAGEVSGPVQTQFGWHVIKLNETRTRDVPPFSEVRGTLVTELQEKAVSSYIDNLVNGSNVSRSDKADMDMSILSNFGLLEN